MWGEDPGEEEIHNYVLTRAGGVRLSTEKILCSPEFVSMVSSRSIVALSLCPHSSQGC